MSAPHPLAIDGGHGEGGGQILRSALALAALTGRAIRIDRIRVNRPNPGLAAQHLAGVRLAAQLCLARIDGDFLGSTRLEFRPTRPPRAGRYEFDVAKQREGGSAGSVGLLLQTALPPLAIADGDSELVLSGGTHVPWSPPYDYLAEVYRPVLSRFGIEIELALIRSGWYPVGQGEVRARIRGPSVVTGQDLTERGQLKRIHGRALAVNLPAHIAQRMADRARAMFKAHGLFADIVAERPNAACAGAGLFLTALYEHVPAGFNAFGRPGKPAEDVAEEAVLDLLAHHRTGGALDRHLGDQVLLPASLATGESRFTVAQITRHLTTNARVIEQFGLAKITVHGLEGEPGAVVVTPTTRPLDRV